MLKKLHVDTGITFPGYSENSVKAVLPLAGICLNRMIYRKMMFISKDFDSYQRNYHISAVG